MPLTNSTILLAIINMISFLIAFELPFNGQKMRHNGGGMSSKTAKKEAIFFFLLSMVPRIYRILIGSDMPLSSVIELLYFPSIALAISSKDRAFSILFFILIFLRLLNGFNRTGILFIFVTILISLEEYYIKDKKSKKRFQLLIVFMIIIFLSLFELRDYLREDHTVFSYFAGGYELNDIASYYTKGNRTIWRGPPSLMLPYMYLTTPWNNLQFVIETQNTRTYGLWLLRPMLGYFSLDSNFVDQYRLVPYSSFNTFTYLSVLFKDFGYWGSCFGSVLLGLFVKYVYSLYKNSNSAFIIACYALTSCAVAEMFFSNHFFSQSYPFTIILLYFIYYILKKIIIKSIEYDQSYR